MVTRVLIVEPEPGLRAYLASALADAGFHPVAAETGASALALFQSEAPAFLVIELLLPDMPGEDVCRRVLASRPVPILIASSRASEADRVAGLELGAADYVCKPYSVRELCLRVRAILARTRSPQDESELRAGSLRVDLLGFRVLVHDRDVTVSPLEHRLLAALLRNRGRVLTREDLLAAGWESASADVLERTVDAHIMNLRAKLGDEGARIETVRGIGYRLR